jgi:hypothetical protein
LGQGFTDIAQGVSINALPQGLVGQSVASLLGGC